MSTDWKDLIEPVADRLLAGERYQNTADGRRYGTHGSLLIHTSGPRRGTWYDFEEDVGGGVLDLIQHIVRTDKKGALKWLRDNGLLKDDDRDRRDRNGRKGPRPATEAAARAVGGKSPSSSPSQRPAAAAPVTSSPAPRRHANGDEHEPQQLGTAAVAAAALAEAVPIAGTPGAAYLANRRTWPADAGPLPGCVRWLPPAAVMQLPEWETANGRMVHLTPPADPDQPIPSSPHDPVPPGGWQPLMCGVIVWELRRPGADPDSVEFEAVNMHGDRPEKWKRTCGIKRGHVFELPIPTGPPWPDPAAPPLAVALVEGGADALAVFRLKLPGVLIRAGAGTGGMKAEVVADLPLDVPVVILGDNDAGGRRRARALQHELDATGRTCYAPRMPRGYKDPDEVLRDADVADLAEMHNQRAGFYEFDCRIDLRIAAARALDDVIRTLTAKR